MSETIYTMGYGAWKNTKKRKAGTLGALRAAGVTMLVDIRHSPCASDPYGPSNYTAKSWHLQKNTGIEAELANAGIEYRWIVELGNPQKRDKEMLILRKHLEDGDLRWPVNRGLELLTELLNRHANRCCLLCACANYEECHRKLVAETVVRNNATVVESIIDLSNRGALVVHPNNFSG